MRKPRNEHMSAGLPSMVRAGVIRIDVPFYQFEWIGHEWLTYNFWRGMFYLNDRERMLEHDWMLFGRAETAQGWMSGEAFAVEKTRAIAVLTGMAEGADAPLDITPVSHDVSLAAWDSEARGAVFPDGLAVSYNYFKGAKNYKFVVWHSKERSLEVTDARHG